MDMLMTVRDKAQSIRTTSTIPKWEGRGEELIEQSRSRSELVKHDGGQ